MKAYPYMHKHPTSGQTTMSDGMDLRDYFAAQAMQGICASGPTTEWSNIRLAAEAYDLADAMMEAREVKHEQS
jgi:hypothetical protein